MKLKFKVFYALICLFTASVAVAQDGLILTAEENKEWIENLKAEEKLNQQLNSLQKRIMADTAVNSSSHFICFTGLSSERRKEIEAKTKAEKPGKNLHSRHRPIYQFVNNKEVIYLSSIKGKTAENLQEFLTTKKVSALEIYYDQPENVLYGVRGESGVILIRIKEEKTFDRLQQLLL
ncbi:hypothetical protein ACWBC2_08140 [Salegentibacter agarivorans]